MTGKIVTIAQQKGGAGKSTLAAHLALAWALKKKSVALVDIDPQQSLAAWYGQREISLGADLVLVPVQPSPLDVWATLPTLEMAVKEKSAVLLVLNRVPPRANLTAQMITKLGGYKVTVAKSTIGNRVAFADAMVSGRTALETKASSVAAKELRALANELAKAL